MVVDVDVGVDVGVGVGVDVDAAVGVGVAYDDYEDNDDTNDDYYQYVDEEDYTPSSDDDDGDVIYHAVPTKRRRLEVYTDRKQPVSASKRQQALDESLHDIQCLCKPGAGKRQNENANTADNLVQSKKSNN